MKQTFKYLCMAFTAVAMLAFTSCGGDDPKPENPDTPDTPENPTTANAVDGHSFFGHLNDAGTFLYGQNGQEYELPVEMSVTVDFNATTADMTVDLNIGGTDQQPSTLSCNYTLSGSDGMFTVQGQSLPFTYDAQAKTITFDMMIGIAASQGDQAQPVGGHFVCNQVS